MMPLTVWMNYPTTYQGDLFRSLVDSGEVDLLVVFARRVPEDRAPLRWENDLDGYPHRFLNPRNRLGNAMRLAWSQRDRIHLVNGIWAEPAFTGAMMALAGAGAVYAIHSEAPEPGVPRSAFLRLSRGILGRALTRRAKGVFAISHFAEAFYHAIGAPDGTLYPFGYFRSEARRGATNLTPKPEIVGKIIFVGQFIARKGLDLLLEAIRPLFDEFPEITLALIGDGELLPRLRSEVEAMNLGHRVIFEGGVPPRDIPARIAAADLLVLPSRWDGWGVVVNEAYQVGVPVIVSDRCGASDIVQHRNSGYVFRSGDAGDLRTCLRGFLDCPHDLPRLRANAAIFGERISTEVVAPYLLDCLRHMTGQVAEKPVPPWSQLPVSTGAV